MLQRQDKKVSVIPCSVVVLFTKIIHEISYRASSSGSKMAFRAHKQIINNEVALDNENSRVYSGQLIRQIAAITNILLQAMCK